jgi:O-antigen/teichoic acid export membrane protein
MGRRDTTPVYRGGTELDMESRKPGVMTVSRPPALLHSGVSAITLGNIAVAVSVAAMLAAGPRLLGHGAFVGLGLAWTLTTLFGFGLAVPTEQLITRRTSSRDPRGVALPIRNLVLLCLTACSVLPLVAREADATSTFPLLAPCAAAGLVGWTVLALARGRIAGVSDLRAYARSLGLEALLRLLLVSAAVMRPAWAPLLLAGSVGAPTIVTGLVGLRLRREYPVITGTSGREREHLTFILVAAGYQLCLNSAPLVLAWRLDPTTRVGVGAFVIASSYYRLASILGGGFATQTLVSLSQLWAQGQREDFRGQLARGVLGAGVVTAAATVGVLLLGPVAVPLLNGRDPELDAPVVAALAVSTVLATAAAVATTALMASRHGRSAAAWWIGGALVHVSLMALSKDIGVTTAVALLAGPAIVLTGILTTTARVLRRSAVGRDPRASRSPA